jgi:hypothetical protein
LGAAPAVTGRALAPWRLWTAILIGPAAWAVDLEASYALAHWACHGHRGVLHVLTGLALAAVAGGAVLAVEALRAAGSAPTDAGSSIARARFMALLGLATTAFFVLVVVAGDLPRWVLDGCR